MDRTAQAELSDKYSMRTMGPRLLYVLLVVFAFFFVKSTFLTPPEVAVAPVRQQDVAAEVQGTGTIDVDVLAAVGAKIPGRIERVLVNEGDFVLPGQVVATLEDTDLRRELQRAQARLDVVRLTEQEARAVEQAARATEQARRATEYQAERAWEREMHLVATGAVSQEEADQYEERYRMATSEVGAAQAQVAAASAKARAAPSEIAAAEAEVRLRQFTLSETKIFTYVNGVVADRPKQPGDAIVPGEAVLTVADPHVIVVDAYVDQRFAGKIRAGQAAAVILRGRGNEQIPGRVYRIRPQADPAAEEMTVEIAFPLSPAELQIGQWADVYIRVGEIKNALVVPKPAILPAGDERVVLVAGADHRVRQVRVEPLASSPRSPIVAVAGDLEPGDWVLTKPMGIRPGQKVRTAPRAGAAAPGSEAARAAIIQQEIR